MNEEKGVRINKYLSEAGVCSRREADRLIADGRVLLDGNIPQAGDRVRDGQEVFVDHKRITKETEEIYLAFYKPRGIICTTAQEENGEEVQNVIDYIHYPKRIYPVGRLDQNSEGLLLLTNQGDLMEKILRSRYDHEKEYYVGVRQKITKGFIEAMSIGVPILDTVTKPCKVWPIDDYHFRIILTQGLNRQIRRMCDALGYRVNSLRRDRVMNITLDGLEKGQYRKLTQEEITSLKKYCYQSLQ